MFAGCCLFDGLLEAAKLIYTKSNDNLGLAETLLAMDDIEGSLIPAEKCGNLTIWEKLCENALCHG